MATTLDAAQAAVRPEVAAEPTGGLVTLLTRRVVPLTMVLVTFVVMVREAAAPLSNPDTYFHLRFGSEFLHHWSLRDPGHVTSWATADWVPTQWLPQELMARLEASFGLPGVAWYAGLQFLALALTLYLTARRWADPVVAAPLLVVGLLACSPGLSMRPQVLSYLASALVVALWMSVRHDPRVPTWRPWLAVPLIWVWAMCHGMWPLGVVISLAAVAGLALDRKLRGLALLRVGAVPVVAAVVAGLLTPVGAALLPAVVLVNSRGKYFSEWGPPNYHHPNALALLLILLVTVLVLVRRGSDWTSIALVGLAAGFAVYSSRTVPVAACLLVPVAAFALQGAVGPVRRLRRPERWLVVGAAVTSLGVLAALVPTTSQDPPPQPAWVDPTLTALPEGTRILNESVFGGYLMWRYPDLDFMFSGYGDIYTDDELETMSRIGDLRPGWDDLIRDAAPEYALVDPQSGLAYALTRSEGWTVLERDDDVELLGPPAGWMDGR